MFKSIQFFTFLIFCSGSINSFAGIGNIGNGGDVVVCNLINWSKTYNLDYLVAEERSGPDNQIIVDRSIETSIHRLARIIEKKAPALSPSFNDFFQNLYNTDRSKKHIWVAEDSLPDVEDENLENQNSHICDNAMARPDVKQAFIRKASHHPIYGVQVVLTYNRQIYEPLKFENPTQLSFLLVHEWLWDLNQDVAQNRNLNYFLHSKNIEGMSPVQVINKLRQLGLSLKK